MKHFKKNNGLTLVALVITVIVMLILAGITVSFVTDDNGIIKNAKDADKSKNKSEEVEVVEWAAANSVAVSDIGKVTGDNLEHYMDTYIGENTNGEMDYEIESGYNDIFLVKFKVSGNEYTVDQNGNVYEGKELDRDGITLPDSLILNVGETVKLEYDSEASEVTWSNSNDKIAELKDDGTVTGIQNGQTVITAKTSKNKTDRCYVIVQTEPEEVKVEPASNVIDLSSMDRAVQLTATILPETANVYTDLTWTSSDTNVATVSQEGFVIGVANGTTTITATTENGIVGSSTITVQTSPTGLNLNAVSAILDRSKVPEIQLEVVSFMPETANVGTNVTWTSSDKSVATVDEAGFVKGIKNGSATITATTENGITAECRIVVVTTITEISVEPNIVTIKPGETATIVAHIKPDDGTCTEDVIWTSSNTGVAKVSSSGNNQTTCTVTSTGSGEVTITAKNTDGKIKSTCKVVVLPTISNTNETYSVKAWYEDIYETSCSTSGGFQSGDLSGKVANPIICQAVCNIFNSGRDCDCDPVTTCKEVYAGQELRTDSATINFKLSSYFDTSKLKLVKEGISQVSVGGLQVINQNNATYRFNISTRSTNFGSGKIKLVYDDGDIAIELYSWNITCK